jgi:hypothetical protein
MIIIRKMEREAFSPHEMSVNEIYAPNMYMAPWAKLNMPDIPQIREKPKAMRTYMDPVSKPFNICSTIRLNNVQTP